MWGGGGGGGGGGDLLNKVMRGTYSKKLPYERRYKSYNTCRVFGLCIQLLTCKYTNSIFRSASPKWKGTFNSHTSAVRFLVERHLHKKLLIRFVWTK